MLGLRLFTSAELPLSLRYLSPDPDHLILEGGCGTGRMTAALSVSTSPKNPFGSRKASCLRNLPRRPFFFRRTSLSSPYVRKGLTV
jgi:hypothetical protein